jgi:hypothetical protein
MEEESYRNFLYIEEVNSNDTTSRRISGITTIQSVEDLKKSIASTLGHPDGWSSISVAFAGQDLSERENHLCTTIRTTLKMLQILQRSAPKEFRMLVYLHQYCKYMLTAWI